MSLVPPPPREPSPQARALLFRPDARQLGWLIGGGVFTLVGAILCVVFCRGVPADFALELSHQTTQGRVIERHVDTHTRINGASPVVLEFSYLVNGLELGGSSGCAHCPAASLAPGAPVDVDYVPQLPSFARVRGTNAGIFPVWLGLLVLFPAAGLWALLTGIGISRRRARAFRTGEEAPGLITFFGRDLSVQINGNNPMRVVWSFEKGGKQYRGALSRMRLPELRQGDPVTVLHDPDDPSVNVLWIE